MVGHYAEDIVHDAFELAWARQARGLVTNVAVAIRQAIQAHKRAIGRIEVGLPLSLPDAADLAETVDNRRKLQAAQRALTADELEMLLDEYDGHNANKRSAIRIARRRARQYAETRLAA